MQRSHPGHYVTISTVGEQVRAFIPAPLPPVPAIDWSPALRDTYDRALLALGRLDSVSMLLPETSLFLYSYIRKEAVLSSQIEGTQSSLSDLLLFELDQLPGVPLDDVREVSNYVAALEYGLQRLADGFPLSLRLLREIHGVLLSKGRGSDRAPGEFRRSQNWIGGSRPGNAAFVPPPPEQVLECIGQLEFFLHDQTERTPALVKAALAHVQFETIHPFLDGNGRLGRLLITLLLCTEQVLHKPMLYLFRQWQALGNARDEFVPQRTGQQQADLRAATIDEGVGADSGRKPDHVGLGEERRTLKTERGGGVIDAIQNSFGEIVRGGIDL